MSDPEATEVGSSPISKSEVEAILDNNLTDKFELLRGTPGYCLDKVGWERAVNLIEEGTTHSLGQLGRHPSSSVIYRQFRRKVLEEYASLLDLVKITIMDYPHKITPDGKKAVDPDVAYTCLPCWRLNDFPYYFTEGIEHHNLWSPTPLSGDDIIKEIEKHRQGWEYVYFVNPGPLASIPELWHAHIVSRRKGQYS